MKLPRWLNHPYTHAACLLLSLLAAVAVVAFMVGSLEYTKMRGRLLLTALMVAGYFFTTLVATGAPNEGAARWLSVTIFGLATMALFLLLAGLWITPDSNEFWKSAAGVTVLALGTSFAGLALGLSSSGRKARTLAWASAALSAGLTAMIVVGIAAQIGMAPYWWAFGLLMLCWLATGVGLAAARIMSRKTSTI